MVCHSDIKPAAIPLTTSNLPRLLHPFFTQYLDKQSLAHASVYGLPPDLNLPSKRLQLAPLTSHIGLRGPLHLPHVRLPDSQVRQSDHHAWGGICIYLARPNNFAGFATVRSFLGFAEGWVSPAFITITSIWESGGRTSPPRRRRG